MPVVLGKNKKRPLTEEQQADAQAWSDARIPLTDVAKKWGVSPTTAYYIILRRGYPKPGKLAPRRARKNKEQVCE